MKQKSILPLCSWRLLRGHWDEGLYLKILHPGVRNCLEMETEIQQGEKEHSENLRDWVSAHLWGGTEERGESHTQLNNHFSGEKSSLEKSCQLYIKRSGLSRLLLNSCHVFERALRAQLPHLRPSV